MKTYRNVKGLVVYEKGENYTIALQIRGKIRYFILFYRKIKPRDLGFNPHHTNENKIECQNRFFVSLVNRLEKQSDR